MRDLDAINPRQMRPSRFVGICAGLPLILGLVSLPLASGAAPDVPFMENPVAQLLFFVVGTSLAIALMASVLKWDWKAKYYGLTLLSGISISLFAIVPLLALMVYGRAPLWLKALILMVYVISHFLWCRKFFVLYQDIFANEILRAVVYEEEADAVYYSRRGDQFLLGKYYKFSQMPRDRYFAIFILLGLALMPMMSNVSAIMGIPFAHVFLLVSMLPVSWMSFGFAARGYLVCYFYPAKIKNATGKEVYVDVAGAHRPLDKERLLATGVKRPGF